MVMPVMGLPRHARETTTRVSPLEWADRAVFAPPAIPGIVVHRARGAPPRVHRPRGLVAWVRAVNLSRRRPD